MYNNQSVNRMGEILNGPTVGLLPKTEPQGTRTATEHLELQ